MIAGKSWQYLFIIYISIKFLNVYKIAHNKTRETIKNVAMCVDKRTLIII